MTGAGKTSGGATQLALPLEPPAPPELEPLGDWGKLIADYRSTGLTLGRHPLEMLRPGLDPRSSAPRIWRRRVNDSVVEVGGMVVARQRPETANGIVFMLLEDERGTVNLIVLLPVYDRHRALVRAAPLLGAKGKLERREGAINVIVTKVWALERTEKPSRPPAPLPAVSGHNASPPARRPRRSHAPTLIPASSASTPSPSSAPWRWPATASAAAVDRSLPAAQPNVTLLEWRIGERPFSKI